MTSSTPQVLPSTAPSIIHRLSVNNLGDFYKEYCVWAYPKPRKSKLQVHLRTTCSGIVSYVLGYDWENVEDLYKRIQDDATTATDADEIALAGRVLKAGGVALSLSYRLPCGEYDALNLAWSQFRKEKDYIFGWPETGGVWVLRIVHPTITGDTEEGMEVIEEMCDMVALGTLPAETFREITQGPVDQSLLTKAKSMAEYCKILQELGAKFYNNPADSIEVEKCKLLDEQLPGHWS